MAGKFNLPLEEDGFMVYNSEDRNIFDVEMDTDGKALVHAINQHDPLVDTLQKLYDRLDGWCESDFMDTAKELLEKENET